jgi:hypothetical protein
MPKIARIQLNDEIFILGLNNNLTKKENAKISKIIFSYKWEIWKNRNKNIFENTTDPPEVIFNKITCKGHLKPKS